MTALVLSAAEYTELVRQHHTNPEGPVVLTSQGDLCPKCGGTQRRLVDGHSFHCSGCHYPGERVAPSRWATSSPTTCKLCGGAGTVCGCTARYGWRVYHVADCGTRADCPACGGSGATRTIELRTSWPPEQPVVAAGNKFFAITGSMDNGLTEIAQDGTVLVGRAASCEVLPIYASDDLPEDYRNTIEVNPYGEVWHHPAVVDPFQRYGLVLDPLPSPGDYALIITGYETCDTRQTEHTQTGERA